MILCCASGPPYTLALASACVTGINNLYTSLLNLLTHSPTIGKAHPTAAPIPNSLAEASSDSDIGLNTAAPKAHSPAPCSTF